MRFVRRIHTKGRAAAALAQTKGRALAVVPHANDRAGAVPGHPEVRAGLVLPQTKGRAGLVLPQGGVAGCHGARGGGPQSRVQSAKVQARTTGRADGQLASEIWPRQLSGQLFCDQTPQQNSCLNNKTDVLGVWQLVPNL